MISPHMQEGIGAISRPKGLPDNLQFAYFAGPRAVTSDAVPDERLFQDPSGMVRFEQPDNEALSTIQSEEEYPARVLNLKTGEEWNPGDAGGNMTTLGALYSHPTLYEDYPHLKDMPVMMLPSISMGATGGFSTPDMIKNGGFEDFYQFMEDPEAAKAMITESPYGAFFVNPVWTAESGDSGDQSMSEFIRKVLGHEVQHDIDEYEGAQYEGSSRTYKRRPGEFVARQAADRMDLPEDDRFSNIQYYVTDPMRDGADWLDPIDRPGLWETLVGPDTEYLRELLNKQRNGD